MTKPFIICLIDDDDIYQFTFTKGLKGSNVAKKILVFSDGEEAMDFMIDNVANTEALPDVIFLDINMPIMDGWQFLDEIVKIPTSKKVTIYIVSSSIDPMDLKKAKQYSVVTNYLIKPMTIANLEKVVNSIEI